MSGIDPSPAPRLVTVCINDETCANASDNSRRHELVDDVVAQISERGWRDVDAILFPGGFLRASSAMAAASPEGRRRALRTSPLIVPLVHTARALERLGSPGCLIVFGIDGPGGAKLRKDSEAPNQEQYCAAVSARGLVGLARKIFPSPWEARNGFAPSLEDYNDKGRIVRLACGRSAVLCACYDMFGATGVEDALRRTRPIERVFAGGRRVGNGHKALETAVRAHHQLLAEDQVSVGLAAIHAFPAAEDATAAAGVVMWQRHGIASCSAGLRGGYAVGAAHFGIALPRTPAVSPLAAARVPKRHLMMADKRGRKTHNWSPALAFTRDETLVRLYT